MPAQFKIRQAVIPAAGIGTRLRPASEKLPKELFPIVNRPIIDYVIAEAREVGIEEIILVLSPAKKIFFEELGAGVKIILQEEPRGLGHAVLMARPLMRDDFFVVLLPDNLIVSERSCLAQMLSVWTEQAMGGIAVQRVPSAMIPHYGIISLASSHGRVHRIKHVVEKPSAATAPSDLGIIGRYILPTEIMSVLETVTPGAKGEIQLSDAIAKLLEVKPLFAYEFEGTLYDAGQPLGFIEANLAFGMAQDELRSPLQDFIKGLL